MGYTYRDLAPMEELYTAAPKVAKEWVCICRDCMGLMQLCELRGL